MTRLAIRLLLGVLVLTGFAGCTRSIPILQQEQLFTLQYGKMEDQVELFMEGEAVTRKTRIAMRGGLFFIASGYGNRIMQFTSYGDLLALYYNPNENPRPVMLQSGSDDTRLTNRRAYPHSFNMVGEIAVTSDNTLLVEDEVPDRVAVFDDSLGVKLNRVVLRIDRNGNQIDYLGQEGIGGNFFPYIQDIQVTNSDQIVVITTAPPKSIVYWFTADGTLLRRIEITPETLPVPNDVQAMPILESVTPDRQLPRLYAKINYYVRQGRGSSGNAGTVDRIMSRIYWINIEDGTYEGYVDVPRNIKKASVPGSQAGDQEYYYELIGAANGEHLFLLSQESETESQLLILHTSGKVVRRRTLDIDYNEIVFRDLDLSANGILSGLFATRDDVRIDWWRTDKLFDGGQ